MTATNIKLFFCDFLFIKSFCTQAHVFFSYWYYFNKTYLGICICFVYFRGPVLDIDATPSHGAVIMSSDRRRVGWDIGQKFPSKTLEVTLQAKIRFTEASSKQDTGVLWRSILHRDKCIHVGTYSPLGATCIWRWILYL